jgi:hypothetical protein
MSHLGAHFETILERISIILEPFWQPFCDHFGIILGAILDAILSPF